MSESARKVVAVLNDLMFTVRIQEAAKRAGLQTVFVKSQPEALAQAKQKPVLIILDLNYDGAEPLALISALKADGSTSDVRLVGYVSHVQVDLRQAAQAKGCDLVIARSAFVQNLPGILRESSEISGQAV